MTTTLFSPLTIGRLNLQNQVIVSPMCQYSAEGGVAGDWAYVAVTTVYLFFQWPHADVLGLPIIIGTIAVVAVFAVLQQRGLSAIAQDKRA